MSDLSFNISHLGCDAMWFIYTHMHTLEPAPSYDSVNITISNPWHS